MAEWSYRHDPRQDAARDVRGHIEPERSGRAVAEGIDAATGEELIWRLRERQLRRVDLLTWSGKAGPNQRMRSRRSINKTNNSLKEGVSLRRD